MNVATMVSLPMALILLPMITGTQFNLNRKFGNVAFSYPGEKPLEHRIDLMPLNAKRVCSDSTSTCVDVVGAIRVGNKKEFDKLSMATSERLSLTTCYEKIRVMVSPDCPITQSTDFTQLKISDFCIGGLVGLNGPVNFRYGMSRPVTVRFNVSRSRDDFIEPDNYFGNPGNDIGRRGSKKFYSFDFDGCDLAEKMMCPPGQNRHCGCPIKEGIFAFINNGYKMEKDFIPENFGYGQFVAQIIVASHEDIMCFYLSFTRKRKLILPWD